MQSEKSYNKYESTELRYLWGITGGSPIELTLEAKSWRAGVTHAKKGRCKYVYRDLLMKANWACLGNAKRFGRTLATAGLGVVE